MYVEMFAYCVIYACKIDYLVLHIMWIKFAIGIIYSLCPYRS